MAAQRIRFPGRLGVCFVLICNALLNFAFALVAVLLSIIHSLSYSLDTYFWSLCSPGHYVRIRGSVMNSGVPALSSLQALGGVCAGAGSGSVVWEH